LREADVQIRLELVLREGLDLVHREVPRGCRLLGHVEDRGGLEDRKVVRLDV
jgi:hypothetical protein